MSNPSKKRHLFSRISHWGVTKDMTPKFSKRIILTNLLGLLFTCNMTVSALAFLYFKQYALAAFTFFFVVTEFTWPVLNYFKFYTLSRIGLLISSNILGFCVSIVLPDTGYNRGFFVMAGLPVLLFGLHEKKSFFLGLLLPIVLYPLSEYFHYSLGLPAWANQFIFIAIGMVYVVLIFLMFLFLARENERAESLLEDQRARTFSSAKFAALGEMAGGIGHEINNPMTVIELNTEQVRYLISNDLSKAEVMERLNVISKTVSRISKIIDSMRNFSREAKNDDFQMESLESIVTDTLTLCAERFKHHHIKLTVNYSRTGIQLNCRAAQVSQILLNLLINSYDAIEELPEKWIKLDIVEESGKVVISVTDSGQGVEEELRDKIFQPFYTTKAVGKGTGLGLSLSRKMAQDHSGALTLDPTSPNTRFILKL